MKSVIANNGALCSFSGERTGRVPGDKRVVCDNDTINEVWWGDSNIKLSSESYNTLERTAVDYLNNRKKLYIVDGYIGWDPKYRLKARVLCTRSYHALFMRNMLIKPTKE